MKVMKLRSPAKLNLRLDVLNRRSDGYHDLLMINSAVDLYDEIECALIEKGIIVECENDNDVPNGEDNITYQVAKEILAYSNKNIGVRINIKKNIPSAAGMGGGSSNAAAVLMCLNEMLKINLSKDKLAKIGVKFGADVPFFIYQTPAVATGIGEQIEKIKKMPRLPMVILAPNIKVPTKWVFERYAALNDNQPVNRQQRSEIPDQFPTKKSVIKFLNNDLERVTVAKYPVLKELKSVLEKLGAMATQMTGSGPAVFGIFPDTETAQAAYEKLNNKITECRVFCVENI